MPRTLDVEAMRAACSLFEGELDFASFAKKPNFERATTVRNVQRVELQADGPEITIRITADSFLYKMVRLLTGRFRSPVKRSAVRKALAHVRKEPLWKVEEAWSPEGFLSPGTVVPDAVTQDTDIFLPLPPGALSISTDGR